MPEAKDNPPVDTKNLTAVQKATTATKAARSEEPVSGDFPADGQVISEDGVFNGETRYEGSVLVERKVGEDWVTVMTDKPRPGDRVQAQSLNVETGEREVSKESGDKPGATRMPGKA
jgi:hypothetical protein